MSLDWESSLEKWTWPEPENRMELVQAEGGSDGDLQSSRSI